MGGVPSQRRRNQAGDRHHARRGYDIGTVQELPGHKDVKTTKVYTYVLSQDPKGVRSPMDDVSTARYADQHRAPIVRSENTQGTGG